MSENYSRPPSPQRQGSGRFALGCAGLAIAGLAVVLAIALYGGWFFAEGYKHDQGLNSALALVRSNSVAQSILGEDIAIEEMQSETFSATTGDGRTVSYIVRLKGRRAEGLLHVMLHSQGNDTKIVSIVLTGPDDERYNLTAPESTPARSI